MYRVLVLAARARRQGTLHESDCDLLPKLSPPSEKIISDATALWEVEQNTRKQKASLWRVGLAAVRCPLAVAATLLTLRGVCNAFLLPVMIKYIIEALIANDVPRVRLLMLVLLLERACSAAFEHLGFRLSMTKIPTTFTVAIGGLVLNKAASPGIVGMQDAGVDPLAFMGRELSIVHTRSSQMLGNGLVALPTLISGCVALFFLLGWSAMFGITWLVISIRIGIKIQDYAKKAEGRMNVIASERLGALNNVLGAIKAIKYFAWEHEFLEMLLDARRRECIKLQDRQRWNSLAVANGKLTPVTGSLATFVAFALLGNEIRAGDIFAANSVFMTLRFAVGATSFLTELLKTTMLTLSRGQKLLLLPERTPRALLEYDDDVVVDLTDLKVSYPAQATEGKSGTGVEAASCGFQFVTSGTIAVGRRGKLTAICGLVGSGKSTLLSALLGSVDGNASIDGLARTASNVGWCPQKPFIISGTLLDNILLGREFDHDKLTRCLADACLGRDLELLRDGLQEEVGERGTTLSGGQQARVGLARALYGDPALLLLDDPLAAVDATVGRALLQALRLRCIDTDRNRPGAIVVLNQLPLLPNFDHIILVNEGQIHAQGSFADLQEVPQFETLMQGIDSRFLSLEAKEDRQSAAEETRRTTSFVAKEVKLRKAATLVAIDGAVPIEVPRANSWIQKEGTASGFVRWAVWRSYLFAPGRGFFFFMLFVYVLMYVTLGARDYWMTVWADEDGGRQLKYVLVFVFLSVSHIGVVIFTAGLIGSFTSLAGRNLHSDCVQHLMRAPMSYFDETPSGRITSRLGPDLATADTAMGTTLDVLITFSFMFFMMCITVTVKIPMMATLFLITAVISFPVVQGLAIVRQDTKRHSNNAMAPILSNVNETRRGAVLVSALGCKSYFLTRHRELVDKWALLIDGSQYTAPVGMLWCHVLHIFVLIGTGFFTLAHRDTLREHPGLIAMYFSYAMLWGLFAMVTMNAIMGLLTNGASLERLVEFKLGDLPQEAAWKCATDPATKSWPSKGQICFENVALRYREGLPRALDCFQLDVVGGEHLGIVGRTGAGKSSITNILFRLVSCEEGRVIIDNVDIARLGLHTLRRAISMIPQEPIVMSGTVRYNLDPFNSYTEEVLEDVLGKVGLLTDTVNLETSAGGDGSGAGLSAGQKQLLTFGRTLLQETRIVMMDEPTASVDMQTDRRSREVSRIAFKTRTVLTIAHRLDTVRQCDRIAVMDAGKLVEIGPPDVLFGDPKSKLAQMAAASEGVSAPISGDDSLGAEEVFFV